MLNNTRLHSIDGLRALAALWVMIGHFAMWDHAGQNLQLFHDITGCNHLAVTFFIVISGFCLALPVLRGPAAEIHVDTRRFFLGRARRILPTYYVALILAIGLDYVMHALGPRSGFERSVITHIFLIHDVVGYQYGINAPFWSIALEWHIYFLFPLIIAAWRRFGALKACAGAIAISYCIPYVWGIVVQTMYFFGFDHAIWVSPNECTYYIGLFSIGVLAADIFIGNSHWATTARAWPHWGITTTSLIITMMVAITLLGPHPQPNGLVVADYVTALTCASLLVYVSIRPLSKVASVLSTPLLVWIGGFSYSLYATHYIPGLFGMDYIRHHIAPQFHLVASVTILPIIIIGLAYIFALAFEFPFLKKKTSSQANTLNSVNITN